MSLKPKTSRFFLTMNTNRSPVSNVEERELVSNLGDALTDVFKDHNSMRQIIKFLIPGHTYSKLFIQSSAAEFAVEKGGKMKRLHAHVWLEVTHTSKIHLDLEAVKSLVKDRSGIPIPYIHVKANRKDPLANVREYLGKANLYKGKK